jgi:hypothetical protein
MQQLGSYAISQIGTQRETVNAAQIRWITSGLDRIFAFKSQLNLLTRVVIALVGCLTILATLAGMVGLISAAPIEVENPTLFAIGQAVPSDATCIAVGASLQPGAVPTSICTVKREDRTIILNAISQHISSIIIETPQYRIGELITAWGIPSGFSRSGANIIVNWQDRSAYLTTCNFAPTSAVSHIEFHQMPPKGGAWRGFIDAPSSACQKN